MLSVLDSRKRFKWTRYFRILSSKERKRADFSARTSLETVSSGMGYVYVTILEAKLSLLSL